MPGFMGLYEGVERIPVGREITDGQITDYWIEIKTHLTRKDESEAQRALTQIRVHNGDMSGELDGSAYVEERVVRSITNWNLTDTSGTAIPLNRDSILQLPSTVFEQIANRVQELNQARSSSDQAQFHDENGSVHTNGRRRRSGAEPVPVGAGDVAEIRSTDGVGRPE